jgi:hypothetical protein
MGFIAEDIQVLNQNSEMSDLFANAHGNNIL